MIASNNPLAYLDGVKNILMEQIFMINFESSTIISAL